jgi:class 3 adenylate cyclase
MEASAGSEIFLFERFRLDRRGGGLFRADDEGVFVPVTIGSRALDVLSILVAGHGRLVSKDEIMAAVWPSTVVADSNLPIQILALRRILDHGRTHGSCIQTVAGRGYRFVASVTNPDANSHPDPSDLDVSAVSCTAPAERRPITVLSGAIIGFPFAASDTDPEELLAPIAALFRDCSEGIGRYDGFLANFPGEAILAYFGYPAAHEDDAERAVRAGLSLVGVIGRFEAPSRLHARIGIATGLVVIGDVIGEGDRRRPSVVGGALNSATSLQALADPSTILITEGTRRQIGAFFELEDAGIQQPNGVSRQIWRVLGERKGIGRFEALRSGDIPLVGRSEEINLLVRRWSCAKAGDGHVVLLSGEPGVGKSRLAAAFEEHLAEEPHHRLRYFCSSYHQNSALYPIITQLERAAGFERDDTTEQKLEKLEALQAPLSPSEEDVALFADWLSLTRSSRYPPFDFTPQRKKEKTFGAWLRQIEALSRQRPLLIVFEDLQWIDPTSRELLELTIERVERWPVLLITTFRPEFQPPWVGQPQVSTVTVNRLDRRDQSVLVKLIAGGRALPDGVVDQIAQRADGVPLFVEELTKSVLESGLLTEEQDRFVSNGPLSPLAIPRTLHALLTARLDRLASVRAVAQIGAAIGRQFPYALLRAVSRLSEGELQGALTRLVASELVFQRGAPPDAVYSFKHALVQDAAHDSLLRSSRQQLHAQIARALEAQSPELMDTQPELFAQHYSEAGLVEEAVTYWGKAGQRSVSRSAMTEAEAQLQKGLDQLALLPDTPERQRRELEFRVALGAVLYSSKGSAARETGRAYSCARQLWERLGAPAEFLHLPYGQSRYHAYRGEYEHARRLDEDLLRLSRQRNDSAGLVLGHLSFGRNLMLVGEFASSRSHLEGVLRLYEPIPHRLLADQTGTYPQVAAQAYLGSVLLCLGYPEQALARSNGAIAEARRLAHRHPWL